MNVLKPMKSIKSFITRIGKLQAGQSCISPKYDDEIDSRNSTMVITCLTYGVTPRKFSVKNSKNDVIPNGKYNYSTLMERLTFEFGCNRDGTRYSFYDAE